MPPTLESFTISYHRQVDLENSFTYESLIKGLIELGVHFFNFNNVNFKIEKNGTLFNKIFSNRKALRKVRYLNFFKCIQVEKVHDMLNNLDSLESFSIIECGLKDSCTDDLKKLLNPYLTGRKLKTLTLNHNELNNAKETFIKW